MHKIVACIGSNVPDAPERVHRALLWLTSLLPGAVHTPPYETAPEGDCAGTAPYVNAVIIGQTDLSEDALKRLFKEYEQGRRPEHKAASRIIIDVDLVCFDGVAVNPGEFASDYFHKGYNLLKSNM